MQTTISQQVAGLLKDIHSDLVIRATFSLTGAQAYQLAQRLTSLESLITGLDKGGLYIGEAPILDEANERDSHADRENEESVPF